MLGVWFRKYRAQLFRSSEMYWIVEPRVRTHTAPEATGTEIDLSQLLDLQPPFITLHRFSRRDRAGEFCDANKVNRGDQIYNALRYSNQ